MSKSINKVIIIAIVSTVLCFGPQLYLNITQNSSDKSQVLHLLQDKSEEINSLLSLGEYDKVKKDYSRYFHIISKDSTDRVVFWTDGSYDLSLRDTPIYKHLKYIGGEADLYLTATDGIANEYYSRVYDNQPLRRGMRVSSLLGFICLIILSLRFIHKTKLDEFLKLTSGLSSLLLFGIVGTKMKLPLTFFQSLGDHLSSTNLFVIAILAIGIIYILSTWHLTFGKVLKPRKSIYQVISSCLIALSLLLFAYLIKIVINSSIVINELSTPMQYTSGGLFSLFLFAFTSIVVFYASIVLSKDSFADKNMKQKYLAILLGLGLSIPVFYFLKLGLPFLVLYSFIIAFILILDLYNETQPKSAIFIFLWMLIFAGFISSLSFHYLLIQDTLKRKEFVTQYYNNLNPSTSDSIAEIDEAIRSSSIFTQLSTLPYPAKLDQKDFTTFIKEQAGKKLEGMNIEVECYESVGSTIFRNHFVNVSSLKNSLFLSDRLSQYVFYNPFEAKYFLRYQVQNDSYNTTPLELIIKLNQGESVNKYQEDLSFGYSVVNESGILIHKPIPGFDIEVSSLQQFKKDGIHQDHSIAHASPSKGLHIYAYRKLDGLLKPISLFSFVLTIYGILLLILGFINSRFSFLPQEIDVKFDNTSSLRNRIQFTIIILTIFSFILIGLMTIIYFKNVLEKQELIKKEQEISIIVNNVNSILEGGTDAESMSGILTSELDKLSHIHNKNLSLYGPKGSLIAYSSTTTPSLRIPFDVYSQLIKSKTGTHVDYTSNNSLLNAHYISLRDSHTNLSAILAVPEESKSIYSSSILDFLSTILNVYIFLFLVAGTIAIAISNSITQPLARLSEKLKLFKLGKSNEPISWNTKDEIGTLIANYNDLTTKLDESVNILAKTERDIAWREMAKQVAHEIKNPLTPMKLSIQHLQRIGQREGVDMKNAVERISKTLLEQFSNLDQIANSFSNFATMPKASNEKIIINEVVESIHDLFRKREDMNITMTEPINDLYVYADRNHLVRVLNNIVKNAIQAIPTNRVGIINIALEQQGENALIKVSDNGEGIPDDRKDKVFTPNFTTKNSGTGLGLAISANMIEAFNGRIYFETEVGVGTDFYIEVPLMRLDQNYPDNRRVSLD